MNFKKLKPTAFISNIRQIEITITRKEIVDLFLTFLIVFMIVVYKINKA